MEYNLENKVAIRQKDVCLKYEADFLLSPFNSIIGIALDTFNDSKSPINGLRHQTDDKNATGWYIWAGEYSTLDDFFKPVHVQHLFEIYQKIIDYLGLGPGWRFLFDEGYEDVWFDKNLLQLV